MPNFFGFIKGLKLTKGTKVIGAADTVLKGSKAVKAAGSGVSALRTGAGTFAAAVRNLPVFRILAGSAVGIAILDVWKSMTHKVADIFGTDSETSSLILAVSIVVLAAAAISLVRGRRHRHCSCKGRSHGRRRGN